MANYKLTQTGSQIQSILDKADKLPTISSSDNGKTLQVDDNGNIIVATGSGDGGTLYKHAVEIEGMNGSDNLPLDETILLIFITSSPTLIATSELIADNSDKLIYGSYSTNDLYSVSYMGIDNLSFVGIDKATGQQEIFDVVVTNITDIITALGSSTGSSSGTQLYSHQIELLQAAPEDIQFIYYVTTTNEQLTELQFIYDYFGSPNCVSKCVLMEGVFKTIIDYDFNNQEIIVANGNTLTTIELGTLTMIADTVTAL